VIAPVDLQRNELAVVAETAAATTSAEHRRMPVDGHDVRLTVEVYDALDPLRAHSGGLVVVHGLRIGHVGDR
jgi:dihydropteroate synthase